MTIGGSDNPGSGQNPRKVRALSILAGFILGMGLIWYSQSLDDPGVTSSQNGIFAIALGLTLALIGLCIGKR